MSNKISLSLSWPKNANTSLILANSSVPLRWLSIIIRHHFTYYYGYHGNFYSWKDILDEEIILIQLYLFAWIFSYEWILL